MSSCFKPLEDLVGESDQESKEWFIKKSKELMDEAYKKITKELNEMVPDREEGLQ